MLAVQAKKFTSLEGTQEAQGDLKSVVLHSLKLQHVKSSFPLAVGAEISAVDNDCFSATGKPYSFIALADAESSNERTLQEDDISLGAPHSHPFPFSQKCACNPLLTRASLVYSL